MKIEETVEKLELKPGDILLLRLPPNSPRELYDRADKTLARAIDRVGLSGKVSILGCPKDYEIKLIRCKDGE